MSGVWVFRNGVYRLVGNPPSSDGRANGRRKVLVYVPTNEVITSHDMLEQKLGVHVWERYRPRVDPGLLQFHKQTSLDLISLPKQFSCMRSVHMYDIVVKCRDVFEVRDVVVQA